MYLESKHLTSDCCNLPLTLGAQQFVLEVPLSPAERTALRVELEKQANAAMGAPVGRPFMGVMINVPTIVRVHFCQRCIERQIPQLPHLRALLVDTIITTARQRREDQAATEAV